MGAALDGLAIWSTVLVSSLRGGSKSVVVARASAASARIANPVDLLPVDLLSVDLLLMAVSLFGPAFFVPLPAAPAATDEARLHSKVVPMESV